MSEQVFGPQWAVVEIMGRVRIVGLVSEATIAGAGFIRVYVPEMAGQPASTRYFGTASIYAITPITEELARTQLGEWVGRGMLPAGEEDYNE